AAGGTGSARPRPLGGSDDRAGAGRAAADRPVRADRGRTGRAGGAGAGRADAETGAGSAVPAEGAGVNAVPALAVRVDALLLGKAVPYTRPGSRSAIDKRPTDALL